MVTEKKRHHTINVLDSYTKILLSLSEHTHIQFRLQFADLWQTWQMKTICVLKFAQYIKHVISSSTCWNYRIKFKKSKCPHHTQCEPYPNTAKKWMHKAKKNYLKMSSCLPLNHTDTGPKSFGGHTLSRNMATLQNYRGLCHINSQAIAQVEVTLEEERHMTEF